jgi:hypothetical protein
VVSVLPGKNPNARTAIIPLPPGEVLPRLTPELIHDPTHWTKMAGVKVVDGINIAPGLDQSTYAYIKSSTHANLFSIPLQLKLPTAVNDKPQCTNPLCGS